VHAGNDGNEIAGPNEVDPVGESPDEGAPALEMDDGEAIRHALDLGEGDVDGTKELTPKAG